MTATPMETLYKEVVRVIWYASGRHRHGGPFYENASPTDSSAMRDTFSDADQVMKSFQTYVDSSASKSAPLHTGEITLRDRQKISEYVFRGPEDLGVGEVEYLLEIAASLTQTALPIQTTEHERGSAEWFRAESERLGIDNWRGPTRLREAADRILELERQLGRPEDPGHD